MEAVWARRIKSPICRSAGTKSQTDLSGSGEFMDDLAGPSTVRRFNPSGDTQARVRSRVYCCEVLSRDLHSPAVACAVGQQRLLWIRGARKVTWKKNAILVQVPQNLARAHYNAFKHRCKSGDYFCATADARVRRSPLRPTRAKFLCPALFPRRS